MQTMDLIFASIAFALVVLLKTTSADVLVYTTFSNQVSGVGICFPNAISLPQRAELID